MEASFPRIGLSVSESADLGRLGLVERHLRLALGELARVVLRADYVLVYGGHLNPDGYTAFLESEVERYGRYERPIQLVIGWSEHRCLSLSELQQHESKLGLGSEITYLDEDGSPVAFGDDRGEDPEQVDDASASLSALRRYLTGKTDARVFVGGKEEDFKGAMPGIYEEALLAIEADQPVYLAGGFGGATASIAELAAGLDHRWPPGNSLSASSPLHSALERQGWSLTKNGLNEEENQQLATTHRPSEVASLVAVGLNRIFND